MFSDYKMNQTTYYGLLNNNGVFDSKIDSTLWQNIISIIPTNEIESFVVICNLDKEFYPEQKNVLNVEKFFNKYTKILLDLIILRIKK